MRLISRLQVVAGNSLQAELARGTESLHLASHPFLTSARGEAVSEDFCALALISFFSPSESGS